jgi:divalent metal cation (Fe/Co/Zn/Cd) transporter
VEVPAFREPGGLLRTRRRALVAQSLTVGWMVVEAVVAVGAGLLAGSVALVAFGVDSVLELVTAGTVLLGLLGARTAGGGRLSAGERRATRVVGVALYGLIAYIVLSAGYVLLTRHRPAPAPAGIALTAASIVVMAALWRWRLRLAAALGSPSLRADAACSAVCLYLAATTLAGLALNQVAGLWFADPLAALALIWWIRGEAGEALEAARSGEVCACAEDAD